LSWDSEYLVFIKFPLRVGALICLSVVPTGTTVQIPTWSLHRDPRNFSPRPDAFWPERWMAEGPKIAEAQGEDFRLNQSAFIPFSYGESSHVILTYGSQIISIGPEMCVGRQLALHELRVLLSTIVRRFDISFAPGFASEDWTRSLYDHYILFGGSLWLVLQMRK
jgi:cytochrome P450